MRVRVGIAAAVVVAGGAGAFAAVSSHGNSTTTATSAGFTQRSGQWMSETQAMSSAMKTWNNNPSMSLRTISEMKKMSSTSTTSWHSKTLEIERGTVVAISERNREVAVKSTTGQIWVWHTNGADIMNVGSSTTGMTALTGNTMKTPSWWGGHMNKRTKTLADGDSVFIFGEKTHGKLEAQLILFAAPTTTSTATATATPTATSTATSTATATATATTSTTATPTATTSTTATATPTTTSTANSGTTNVNGQTIVVGGNGHD
jgi:hypothetical protein